MMNTTSSSPPKPPLNPSEITQNLTKILAKNPPSISLISSISKFIPHLTPVIIHSVVSSQTLKSNPQILLNFFKISQLHAPSFSNGSPATLPSFFVVLQTLFAHNKWADAKTLLLNFIGADTRHRLLRTILHPSRDIPRLSKALYDTAIGAYIQMGYPHLAMIVFRRMKRLRIPPKLITCNTLLNSLVKHSSSRSILYSREVINDAIRLGVVPNVNMFNIMINGYCLENKFGDARDLMNKMREFNCLPDNVTYNTLLNALCKKGRLKDVRELLLEMKNQGLFPNRNTYNTLVHMYCQRRGSLLEATHIFDLMTQNNFLPDVWTYNTLISGLCNEGKIEEAIRVSNEMEKLKLLPDVITYNTLIDGCFKWKKSSEAIKLLDGMSERGMKRNTVTYNILIKWYCKEGDMGKASETVKHMETNGLFPDSVTYNTLINGYSKAGSLGEALKMMKEMSGRGLQMDSVTVSTVLHALCLEKNKGLLEKAITLFNTWISKGKTVDAVTYNTLVSCLCKEGRFEDAMDLVAEMKEKNLGPDRYTYNAVLVTLTDAGRREEAEDLMSKMIEWGNVLDDLSSHGVQDEPDTSLVACSEDIDKLCTERKYRDALRLFGELSGKGIAVKKSTCISLMCALIKKEMRRLNAV
ncbi:Pentatricopeptide repeat-containing protein [Cynara cardunculus var. scolymus]|uniref:Pentatricopeptide repeat-containing protein n=1 Tax=Cynara cardunculus var. scolymus TaxID=59895 RepID=A0A124SGN2_CYNCS|nr:Pentatricopeptide repeat-containing protein [Cynara cardunculus var. scolymus]